MTETVTIQVEEEKRYEQGSKEIPLKYVLFWGIFLGLILTWMSTYLKISMGFVSVGIGPMAVLLIARQIFRHREQATRRNLTLVIIAYSATTAAEASVSLLFLIWLFSNPEFFGSFNPPSWLLPSPEIINSRTIFSSEWLLPLTVHYFLMFIPGIIGLGLGWMMKDGFIHNPEEYPFPGVVSQDSQVGVLTDEAESTGPLFWRFARISFVVALVTVIIPPLFVIDFSNTARGFIIGLIFGPVGIALLAAGILIGNAKISIGSAVSSIFAYSILSIFLIANRPDLEFYGFFNLLLQDYYFSPAIGLLIGGLIFGPIIWGIFSSLTNRHNQDTEVTDQDSVQASETSNPTETVVQDQITELYTELPMKNKVQYFLAKNWKILLMFVTIYISMIVFIHSWDLLPSTPLWAISLLVFWMTIIGGVVNGYLVTQGTAKANTAFAPPFIFDVAAVYIAGGRGFVPFLAIPSAETDGSAGIVSTQRLAKINDISPRTALIAYLSGYVATTITTPLFALFLWGALGIGTVEFPAPSFPVQGAILASFASGKISSFLNIQILIIALIAGVLVTRINRDLVFGLVIGLLFPPHMAIMMAIGGVIRLVMDQKMGSEISMEKSRILGPGIAVGASFVIPILILLALV